MEVEKFIIFLFLPLKWPVRWIYLYVKWLFIKTDDFIYKFSSH